MKYYDKKMYEMEQKIKTALFTILIFTISFLLGAFIGNAEINCKNQQIKHLQMEINNLKNK
ncbi:MAG: hypothetical protein HFJ35_03105 [Clostridia bacterium]|nr:hypothetical protein [Clostridia bacterium]